MAKAIRYNIAKLSEGRWLRDFTSQIRIVTDGFSDKLLDEATDPTLSKPQQYRNMARRYRERLELRPDGVQAFRETFLPYFGIVEVLIAWDQSLHLGACRKNHR